MLKNPFDFCHKIKYKALCTICITCAHRHNLIWSFRKINFRISCHCLLSQTMECEISPSLNTEHDERFNKTNRSRDPTQTSMMTISGMTMSGDDIWEDNVRITMSGDDI